MYFTSYHKAILKDIWNSSDFYSNNYNKKESPFDLERYMQFCFDWHKKNNKKQIFKRTTVNNDYFVYSRCEFSKKDKKYLVLDKNEMILALKELETLLSFLKESALIDLVEKKQPLCLPLFIDNNGKEEPFTEGLKIVRDYIGMTILVREGYKKFKRFNYRTQNELITFLVGVWLPTIIVILTIIQLIFKK